MCRRCGLLVQWSMVSSFDVPHNHLRFIDLQDLFRVLDEFDPIVSQGHDQRSWQSDPSGNQPYFHEKQRSKMKEEEEDYTSPHLRVLFLDRIERFLSCFFSFFLFLFFEKRL